MMPLDGSKMRLRYAEQVMSDRRVVVEQIWRKLREDVMGGGFENILNLLLDSLWA
jgi:hypothetical protein